MVALSRAYRVLGFETATGGDEVLRALALARVIEPTRKLDSLRIIEEVRVDPLSYATLKRRLPLFAKDSWSQALVAACAASANLVLYDV